MSSPNALLEVWKRRLIRLGAMGIMSGFLLAFLGAAFSTPDVLGNFQGPGLWINRAGLMVMLAGLLVALAGYRLHWFFGSHGRPFGHLRSSVLVVFATSSIPVLVAIVFVMLFSRHAVGGYTTLAIWRLFVSELGLTGAMTVVLASWWLMGAVHREGIHRAYCIGALLPTFLALMFIGVAAGFAAVIGRPTRILPAVVFLWLGAPLSGLLCMGMEVLWFRRHPLAMAESSPRAVEPVERREPREPPSDVDDQRESAAH